MKIIKKGALVLALSMVATFLVSVSLARTDSVEIMNLDEILSGEVSGLVTFDIATEKVISFISEEALEENTARMKAAGLIPDVVSSIERRGIGFEPFNAPNPRTIVTNTTVMRNRTTVHLSITGGDGVVRVASGFMVGPNTVATAGHALYDVFTGGYAKSIVATPARNGNIAPYGTATATTWSVSTQWLNSHSRFHDWGIIRLDKNIGDQTGLANYERRYGNTSNNGLAVRVNGYPSSTMVTSFGTVSDTTDYWFMSRNTSTTGGMSGGPLYYNQGNDNQNITVVAIVLGQTGEDFQFTRISGAFYNSLNLHRYLRV